MVLYSWRDWKSNILVQVMSVGSTLTTMSSWKIMTRKGTMINSIGKEVDDPYTFCSGLGITDDVPNIEYPDIYNYS